MNGDTGTELSSSTPGGDVGDVGGVFGGVIGDVLARMDQMAGRVEEERVRPFLHTYRRTTEAVAQAVRHGSFEDPEWVEHWDAQFAGYYLDALGARLADRPEQVPRPWRLAFDAPAELPPLRHVLLGINAHVNYDLPQALLAVISDADFERPTLMARRRRDHARIDTVLASRVGAEEQELRKSVTLSALDRLLTPLNRAGSRRFLREAREKVWHNTVELQQARVAGPDAYRARLGELEVLSASKIADLLAPGQVLLRLAVSGFGVLLPPA
jgi:hypothetical protein